MVALLRKIPEAVWWVTLFFAVLAVFTQLAITVARSGSVAVERLLFEFVLTLALLAIPVGFAWRARQQGSLWYAAGAVVLLVAFGRIFFL
jgi:hypothetical protein